MPALANSSGSIGVETREMMGGETGFGPMWWMIESVPSVWRGRETGECHWEEGEDDEGRPR